MPPAESDFLASQELSAITTNPSAISNEVSDLITDLTLYMLKIIFHCVWLKNPRSLKCGREVH